MISRRTFILSTLAASGCGLLAASKVYNDSNLTTENLSLTTNQIYIPNLPQAFDGFKIGMLSDPHLSNCGSINLLKSAVDLFADQSLDLLILGGDYLLILDIFSSRYFYTRYSKYASQKSCSRYSPSYAQSLEIGEFHFRQVAEEVSRLNPKHGIIGVLGNHDRWNSAENCIKVFKEFSIPILVNEAIRISEGSRQIEFYGADDYGTGVPLAPDSNFSPRILISHNPDFLAEMADKDCYSLGLAGHTHGGQIVLPFVGPIGFNIENTQLIRGVTSITNSQILVSAGIGTSGIPFRLNCPPEANLIILKA